MKILLIDSYFGGSHKIWATKLQQYSQHDVDIVSLEDRHWKWRMYGGAITLFEKSSELDNYDLYLFTDMVDVSLFRSLNQKNAHKPHLVYFHENQFAYPESANANREEIINYQFINYRSALVSDAVYFNSEFNRKTFLDGCEKLLKLMPDHKNLGTLEEIEKKSSILPVGIDFDEINNYREIRNNEIPLLLWNHRWDYDKGMSEFLTDMLVLKSRGIKFNLALLGKRHPNIEKEYQPILEKLQDEILINENIESYQEYIGWLYRSDILPVTSQHDFFGISVLEAIHCDTHPLLPARMVYPERISSSQDKYLYQGKMIEALLPLIQSYKESVDQELIEAGNVFNWKQLVESYDSSFKVFS